MISVIKRLAQKEHEFKASLDCISTACTKMVFIAMRWWHTPLIPALGRQRQVDLCDVSLVYRVSYTENTCLKNQKKKSYL